DVLAVKILASRRDPYHVVIYVPSLVDGQWARGEGVLVYIVAERVYPLNDGAVRAAQLEYRAALARVVDEVPCQSSVIDRLPEIVDISRSYPIAVECPHLDKLAVVPREPILVPRLGRVVVGVVSSRLGLHEDVVAIG